MTDSESGDSSGEDPEGNKVRLGAVCSHKGMREVRVWKGKLLPP